MTLTTTHTPTDTTPDPTDDGHWVVACAVNRIVPDRGIAAMIQGVPVAIFRLTTEDPDRFEWRAVSHLDPANGMPVMARGLVGSANVDGNVISTVSSPLLKQRYDLASGRCLDDERLALGVFPIRVVDGVVEVGSKSRS